MVAGEEGEKKEKLRVTKTDERGASTLAQIRWVKNKDQGKTGGSYALKGINVRKGPVDCGDKDLQTID